MEYPQDKLFYGERRVENIPVAMIRPNPYQPRKSFSDESITELARSIRRYGLLQPIVVRKVRTGNYELIAGERRLRATKRAGYHTINALVYYAGEQDSAVMALIENLQRENLHFFDEAEAYRNLLIEHGITQEDLARKIGRNQSTVANKLRILRLSPAVRAAILANGLTERHARTLLRLPEESAQLALIERIRAESLSVKATEDLVERLLDREPEAAEPRKRMTAILRDSRLLINEIRKLVGQVAESGLHAEYDVRDVGEFLEVCVKVPKTAKENHA